MDIARTEPPSLGDFTRKAQRLHADLLFGRDGDHEKTMLTIRAEGEKIAATTEHQAVRDFIWRILEDIDYAKSNPQKFNIPSNL